MRHVACVALAFALVGSIDVTSSAGTSTTTVHEPDVRMGALASGSSGGLNGTDGTASVTGTLLSGTTNVLYLNNTGSGVWFAKVVVTASSGIANLPTLMIGIDNGTQTAQIVGTLGALTQTSGAYVELPAASTNRIYVTQAVTTLALTSTITMDVYAADDAAESAFVVTTATITIQ